MTQWCVHVCVSVRDRDRHLAETDSFFPAKLISFNRSYLKEHAIIMWTSLSLVMVVHMSPHLLVAALVLAHQTVSKTENVLSAFRKSCSLIWQRELKLSWATPVVIVGQVLDHFQPDGLCHPVFHFSPCETKCWRGISNAAVVAGDGSNCSASLNVTAAVVRREAVIHLLNEPLMQHSKSFLCLCYKVKSKRMASLARLQQNHKLEGLAINWGSENWPV